MSLALVNQLLEERPLLFFLGSPLLLLSSLPFFFPASSYSSTSSHTSATDYLALVTANTLITHTYVWNLISSCFYEENPWKLILDFLLLWPLTKVVNIGNLEQFLLYFVFSILACTIGTSIFSFTQFIFSGQDTPLLIPWYGFNGVLITLMMLARQSLKNQSLFPGIPGIFLYDMSFTIIAILFTWSYLRFYYKHDNDCYGNTSQEFSFVAMFPETIQIVVVPFSTAFYNIMVLLALFPPLEGFDKRAAYQNHLNKSQGSNSTSVGSNLNSSSSSGSSSSSSSSSASNANSLSAASTTTIAPVDLVGERRRAKALKLLESKMAELAREPEGWDDISLREAEDAELGLKEYSKLKI